MLLHGTGLHPIGALNQQLIILDSNLGHLARFNQMSDSSQ